MLARKSSMSPATRRALSRRLEAIRGLHERYLLYHVKRSWVPLRDALLSMDAIPWVSDITPLVYELGQRQAKVIGHTYRTMGDYMEPLTFGKSRQIKASEDQLIYRTLMENWVNEQMGRHIKHITDTTRDQLVALMDASDNVHEFHDAIKPYFRYDTPHRSYVIARTESAAASNVSADLLMKATGLEDDKTKRWTTILDGNERESHRIADGTVVGFNETFRIDLDELMYPLDSSRGASAANIVNCRCFVQYID